MFEKVNPCHPDKLADRIAGALVDMAYAVEENPRIAVEVLIGHGRCNIIAETSVRLDVDAVKDAVHRIAGDGVSVEYVEVPQDKHLALNQANRSNPRCGDNGIFKGVPVTEEQNNLCILAQDLYDRYGCDGKYIIDDDRVIVCQSNAMKDDIETELRFMPFVKKAEINPLGYWTGGIDVDSGATNRKLGSDMADSVTGGGLHGKDLSKADVSVNVYAWLKAQRENEVVELSCAIGDEKIDGKPYSEIMEIAREYISVIGGFEKFAEWGLVR